MPPKWYTGRGDKGDTGLLYGGRVPKFDLRCEAYGTVDEAVSALGLARALSTKPRVQDIVLRVQRELFLVGAEMATDPQEYDKLQKHFGTVTPAMVQRLEEDIAEMEREVKIPKEFVLPGDAPGSGAMDLARAIIRRAERRAVELRHQDAILNDEVVTYLNRLSSLAFILARYEETPG